MTAGKGDDEGLGVITLDSGSSIIIEAFNDVFGLGM